MVHTWSRMLRYAFSASLAFVVALSFSSLGKGVERSLVGTVVAAANPSVRVPELTQTQSAGILRSLSSLVPAEVVAHLDEVVDAVGTVVPATIRSGDPASVRPLTELVDAVGVDPVRAERVARQLSARIEDESVQAQLFLRAAIAQRPSGERWNALWSEVARGFSPEQVDGVRTQFESLYEALGATEAGTRAHFDAWLNIAQAEGPDSRSWFDVVDAIRKMEAGPNRDVVAASYPSYARVNNEWWAKGQALLRYEKQQRYADEVLDVLELVSDTSSGRVQLQSGLRQWFDHEFAAESQLDFWREASHRGLTRDMERPMSVPETTDLSRSRAELAGIALRPVRYLLDELQRRVGEGRVDDLRGELDFGRLMESEAVAFTTLEDVSKRVPAGSRLEEEIFSLVDRLPNRRHRHDVLLQTRTSRHSMRAWDSAEALVPELQDRQAYDLYSSWFRMNQEQYVRALRETSAGGLN